MSAFGCSSPFSKTRLAIAFLLCLVVLPLHAQVTLSPSTSPTAGQAGVTNVNVTGSNFPSGAISPASVTVSLTPSGGGATVTTSASSVVTIIGSTRRVTFQIPGAIVVGAPANYLVSLSCASPAFTSNNSTLIINPPASIAGVSPGSGQQAQSLSVIITGSFTNFVNGSTKASFGADISVGGAPAGTLGPVTVSTPTSATASIAISNSAALGGRTVTVATGTQQASLVSGFTVTQQTIAPAVTGQPGNQTVCAGNSASFTAAASGSPAPTVQWQVSTDGGVTFNNIGGATSTTLSFAAAAAQNGNKFRAVFTNGSGTATSNAATLTVNTAPAVTTDPGAQTVNDGQTATFTAAASGSPAPTVQWQVSTDGGVTFNNIPGATSTTLSLTAALAQNGNLYRAVFSGSCGTATTTAASLTVRTVPAVTTQPTNQTVCSGSSASFTAAASGSPAPTVQWQVSTDGGVTFNNIGGATSTTLSFTAAAGQNGNQFRAVFTNTAGSATSNAATLTVNTAPVVSSNPVNQVVNDGQTASFTAAASGSPAPTVQWQVSTDGGVTFNNIGGATSTTLSFTAALAQNGNLYRAVFSNGCGSASSLAATLTVNSSQTPQPTSLKVVLSDDIIAPDGSVTAMVTVLDQNNNVMTDPSFQFTVNVTPVGTVTGNSPVVQNLTITFPRVIKALLNQNPTVDPQGLFADADPNDPNYGKETGGTFQVNVSLNGTSVHGSAKVTVMPTGTAGITLKVKQYSQQLQNALSEIHTALQNSDAALLAQGKSDLQGVDGNSDFSADVLSVNNVMTPPNGFPVTPGQLVAAGFTSGPDDAAFQGGLVTALSNIQAARARIALINAANLTQQDIDDMQAIVNTYKQTVAALQALQPSPLGVTNQGDQVNNLLRNELPLLLDAIKGKSLELAAQLPTLGARERMYPSFRGGRARLVLVHQATFKRAQFVDFFFTMFGIMTDLEGAARANIIELCVSLANDVLNIVAAEVVNQFAPGTLSIDFIIASSSLSFCCPNYSPTTVDGFGFTTDPSKMRVLLVGCVDSHTIATLAGLSPAKDLAAAIRLVNDITSIVQELGRQAQVAAVLTPDTVGPGLFDDTEQELIFANGWPRVNQGQLPCVGLIIVVNLDSGSFQATNSNILAVCGP